MGFSGALRRCIGEIGVDGTASVRRFVKSQTLDY